VSSDRANATLEIRGHNSSTYSDCPRQAADVTAVNQTNYSAAANRSAGCPCVRHGSSVDSGSLRMMVLSNIQSIFTLVIVNRK